LLPEPMLLFSAREGRVSPHWFTPGDHPWLRGLLDEYARFVGRPRRELMERLREPLPHAAPGGKLRIARRVLDSLHKSKRVSALSPRHARSVLFATAASSTADARRDDVIAHAAHALETDPASLESSLFADLPGEKHLASPAVGSLEPAGVALRANLLLAQGLVFRAAGIRLELEGGARTVIRHAKLRGLIGVVLPRARSQDAILELSGPFALFRRTLLYGRALAELIPLLGWCDRFSLAAEVVLSGKRLIFELRSGDPVLPAEEPRRFDSKLEERFAREFGKLARDWEIVREPEPVPAEGTLIFPDFALRHRHDPDGRWLLEIVGFWTRPYLEDKLRRLRAAGIPRLILCIDEDRNVGGDDLPVGSRLVRFRRRIDPAAVLRILDEDRHPRAGNQSSFVQ
jgi:predicted nuclease of restriction endonuclease-like RecB superfamily